MPFFSTKQLATLRGGGVYTISHNCGPRLIDIQKVSRTQCVRQLRQIQFISNLRILGLKTVMAMLAVNKMVRLVPTIVPF